MPLLCERLAMPTHGEQQRLREIYENSFPAAERKPFEQIADGIARGAYTCMVARAHDEPNGIAAFAFTLPLPDTMAAFLEYMAVRVERHGQGIGSALFDAVIRESARHRPASQIVWEVEPPDSADPLNHSNRRLRFYERLGGRLVTLSTAYRMPDYERRTDGVPLRLMLVPMEAQPDKKTASALIKSIYDAAYSEHIALRDRILRDLTLLPDAL